MAKVEENSKEVEMEINEEENQVMDQDETKPEKPRKKIFTKKNVMKVVKYGAVFTVGFLARTGFDMIFGGSSSGGVTVMDHEVPVPDMKVDNVVNF